MVVVNRRKSCVSYEHKNRKHPVFSFISIKCQEDGGGTIYLARDEERGDILYSFRARSKEIL